MTTSTLDISQFDYTASYCEENVYRLCKKLSLEEAVDVNDLFIVFITNEKKQVPLWHQKASTRADGVVLWDYHVICVERKREDKSPHVVWDLDSTLPLPSPLASYLSETIRPSFQVFTEFQRFFRVVHAPIFFCFFASDRRHMKDSSGNWISEPPAHEPIVAEDGTVHNLNEYLEVCAAEALKLSESNSKDAVYVNKYGVVIGETQMEEFFSLIIS